MTGDGDGGMTSPDANRYRPRADDPAYDQEPPWFFRQELHGEAFTATYPEPPRNSGEADAANGPTALGTHHDNMSQEDRLGSDSSRP